MPNILRSGRSVIDFENFLNFLPNGKLSLYMLVNILRAEHSEHNAYLFSTHLYSTKT